MYNVQQRILGRRSEVKVTWSRPALCDPTDCSPSGSSVEFVHGILQSRICIFEINPLSVASFAIIFSQSEGCLFTLVIVSFVVQKLSSLFRSHLFIFAFISINLGGGS